MGVAESWLTVRSNYPASANKPFNLPQQEWYFAAVVDHPTLNGISISIRKSADDVLSYNLTGFNPRIVRIPGRAVFDSDKIMACIHASDKAGLSVRI